MPINFPEIIDINISLILSVIFLENGSYVFFILVQIWLSTHSFHKFVETYTTCLLGIELSNNFIHSFFIWIETVLTKEKTDIIWKKYSHTRWIVSIKYLFKIYHIIDRQLPSDIELGFEMLKIFSFKSYSVSMVISLRISFAFLWTIAII